MESLEGCLEILSKNTRVNGTDPLVLQKIYDLSHDFSSISKIISSLPSQNRASKRALWRFCDQKLNLDFESSKHEIINMAFDTLGDIKGKLDLLYYLCAYARNQIVSGILSPEIWDWITTYSQGLNTREIVLS
jgi:hypothetical protein